MSENKKQKKGWARVFSAEEGEIQESKRQWEHWLSSDAGRITIPVMLVVALICAIIVWVI